VGGESRTAAREQIARALVRPASREALEPDAKEELAVVCLSAASGPLRWHYRQKINALAYQAMVE